jgi:uncharacterized LabA/DUF88 family protein
VSILNPAVSDSTYVFIDGNYLRKVADELIGEMFGTAAELNFDAIRPGVNVRRIFYYDCLNDRRGENESEAEFTERVARQEELFGSIQSLRDFHVRLGSVSGRKKLRQKKVDVLLVVDALEHAFRGNMSRFRLIAGDLDFAPLVDCLVRLGTYVEVMYARRSAAVDLYRAADYSEELTLYTVYNWSTKDFHARHPIPRGFIDGAPVPKIFTLIKAGSHNSKTVQLYRSATEYLISVEHYDANNPSLSLSLSFPDPDVLEKYFRLVYGPLEWA